MPWQSGTLTTYATLTHSNKSKDALPCFTTGDYHTTNSIDTAMPAELGWKQLEDHQKDLQLALLFEIVHGHVAAPVNYLKLELLWLRSLRSTNPIPRKHGKLWKTLLTHCGRVTHICVGNLTIIGPDNGLPPGRRQAIIWTNAGILLIEPLRTNFSEISIEIHTFSFKEMHFKMSSGKWRPSCLGLNVLITIQWKRPNLNFQMAVSQKIDNS